MNEPISSANNVACFRMDDVGASTKFFERHGHTRLKVGPVRVPFPGNFWFLKSIEPFRRWGPYRELEVQEWVDILAMLEKFKARMTVAVTGSWVEEDGSLTPFDQKFPGQRDIIRQGVQAGLIEIGNHGLTHCVVERNLFKPRWWRGNRQYHREFWDWIDASIQRDHLERSQDILERSFGVRPVTFVPPGNLYTPATLSLAAEFGLRYLSCSREPAPGSPLSYTSDKNLLAFHDRELVLEGLDWLEKHLTANAGRPYAFVRDLFAETSGAKR